ncbi:MAG TPA: family 1 glycosylhydrolase [Phycisphaerae bacterium]|nr:family 1 glycosylhydrolase [Phycisphaerae bacterium]
MTDSDFPSDFLFGTATSSYQVEGAAGEDGRGESIWDRFCATPGRVRDGHTGDVACDHYHRVDEDIALMKDLGVNAYRFSIAWPRVVPGGDGPVNPKGLDWYSRLVDKLLAAGIRPFATMYHWDLPQAMEERHGGWRSRATADAFGRYAEVLVKRLGDRVRDWITLNEMPATIIAGYQAGFHAPGAQEPPGVVNQIQHHCLLAHGLGVRAVREHGRPGSEVGTAHNARVYVPVYETDEHIAATAEAFCDHNGPMLEAMSRGRYPEKWLSAVGADAPAVTDGDMELIAAPCDFIGLNCYRGVFVRAEEELTGGDAGVGPVENVAAGVGAMATPTSADMVRGAYELLAFPPSYPRGAAKWVQFVPQAIYWGVRLLAEEYGYTRIYITENGTVGIDELRNGEVLDLDRVEYYRLYLAAAARAVAEGYPLRGYFAWSMMDNFEWSQGYHERFGIHYVDFQTLNRTRKLSGDYYREVIRHRRVL